jgi:large subunit ribosomal protein L25
VQDFTLPITKRESAGSAVAGRMRLGGTVPCVVYAAGEATFHGSVSLKEFGALARRATRSQLFTLKSDERSVNGRRALVKEIQKEHLKGTILHIDFQALREDKEISLKVPLHFVGEAPGVKTEGGVMSVAAHELGISCLPKDIPVNIAVDISALALGQSLHAKDLTLPQGVKLSGSPDETVVSIVTVRALVEETPAADATAAATAEGAEGAAAAGAAAEGGAPAKGAPAKAEGDDKKAADKGKK